MLYLCEVIDVSDPLNLNRVRAYILSDMELGESDWMFCAVNKFPQAKTTIDNPDYPDFPQPKVGDLVWASLVSSERNVFAWHSLVPSEQKETTLNEFNEIMDMS